jgi:hypothetical protein
MLSDNDLLKLPQHGDKQKRRVLRWPFEIGNESFHSRIFQLIYKYYKTTTIWKHAKPVII